MRVRHLLLAAAAVVAISMPARAALVLDYLLDPGQDIGNPTASLGSLATNPPLTSLTMNQGDTVVLQVALRDTTGSTIAWSRVAGANYHSLGAFFMQFDSVPGVAVNPSPTDDTHAALVRPAQYAGVNSGTMPPAFTRFGGLINSGAELNANVVPSTANANRIFLFDLVIEAIGGGAGVFHLRDPNPTSNSADSATLNGFVNSANPGTLSTIDDLLYGANFQGTFDLPIVVIGVPEPTSLAFAGLALAGFGVRKLRRKKVVA